MSHLPEIPERGENHCTPPYPLHRLTRVAPPGGLLRQVLVAMMFDDFMSTGMQSLDYDRVVRCAVTIQVDPDVCKVLNATPSTLEECWMPDDACEQRALRFGVGDLSSASMGVPLSAWLAHLRLASHDCSPWDENACACRDHRHVLRLQLDRGAADGALVPESRHHASRDDDARGARQREAHRNQIEQAHPAEDPRTATAAAA